MQGIEGQAQLGKRQKRLIYVPLGETFVRAYIKSMATEGFASCACGNLLKAEAMATGICEEGREEAYEHL